MWPSFQDTLLYVVACYWQLMRKFCLHAIYMVYVS